MCFYTSILALGFEMVIILVVTVFFVGRVFSSLVSVVFSGSQENVVTVGCLVKSASEYLPGVVTTGPVLTVFLCIGS